MHWHSVDGIECTSDGAHVRHSYLSFALSNFEPRERARKRGRGASGQKEIRIEIYRSIGRRQPTAGIGCALLALRIELNGEQTDFDPGNTCNSLESLCIRAIAAAAAAASPPTKCSQSVSQLSLTDDFLISSIMRLHLPIRSDWERHTRRLQRNFALFN